MCATPPQQTACKSSKGTPRSISASGVPYQKVLAGRLNLIHDQMIKDLLETCSDEEVADLAHDLWKSLTTEITFTSRTRGV